jgi:hypothetical protein
MNPLGHSRNIAARAGRWSARHWKTATFGWLALVALLFVLGAIVGTKELTDAGGMNGDSARAERIIDNAGFPDSGVGGRPRPEHDRDGGRRFLQARRR